MRIPFKELRRYDVEELRAARRVIDARSDLVQASPLVPLSLCLVQSM